MRTNKALFRNGIGLDMILAFLLLVLPTLAFIVVLITEYWSLMRIDNNLKLIANMLSQKAQQLQDVRDWEAYTSILATASTYCPNQSTLVKKKVGENSKGDVSILVTYQFDGKFFDKTLSAKIDTLSYHDQNLTATWACE